MSLAERALKLEFNEQDIFQIAGRMTVQAIDYIVDKKPDYQKIEYETLYNEVFERGEETLRYLLSSEYENPLFGAVSVFSQVMLTHPELVMPLGYDEVRFGAQPVGDEMLSEDAIGLDEEIIKERGGPTEDLEMALEFISGTQYRSPNGVWYDSFGVLDNTLPKLIEGEHSTAKLSKWIEALLNEWTERSEATEQSSSAKRNQSVLFPKLWMPEPNHSPPLQTAAQNVLKELGNQSVTFDELHWRELEELVAELLFDMGMQVHVTDRSNDGGRDVIARGELIPGEPTMLAVEVKHRPVVNIGDLREAMWANRHYPALLFVSSGRMSAGVYREKEAQDGALRLFLKDGQGLTQWIQQYFDRNHRHPAKQKS